MSSASPTDTGRVKAEALRRRTVAIISHPDAGKTTMTEQLLLRVGEINRAGSVTGKRGTTSTITDWMSVEQERGISVASSAVRLDTGDNVVNLLDTPGHGDFSEDTYRVLAAVDAAIMLLDAAKGIEPQTRRLFEVCRVRNVPIITFVNKLDRPAENPLDMLEHIERELDLVACPLTWPAGEGDQFRGVVTVPEGARVARSDIEFRDAGDELWSEAEQDGQLAWEACEGFDTERFLAGSMTPVIWGSAVKGFGVGHLLKAIIDHAPAPESRDAVDGEPRGVDDPFSGFVFKLQSNMDPRHRDVAAFIRVVSGRFDRGVKTTIARTGRTSIISQAQEPFGRDRATIDEAWPGDVIVVPNASDLAIGDTIYESKAVEFPRIATFAPHLFREVTLIDSSKRKQFQRGIEQLGAEGVVQVLIDQRVGLQRPVLGGVGVLQFEVFQHRMENEFGADVRLHLLPLGASVACSAESLTNLPRFMGMRAFERRNGGGLLAFETEWTLQRFRKDHPDIGVDEVLHE